MVRDARLQSPFYMSFRVPSKEAPSGFPSQSSHRDRRSTPRAPFNLPTWRPRVPTFLSDPRGSPKFLSTNRTHSEECHLLYAKLASVQLPQAVPLNRKSLLESQTAELSFFSKFASVVSISGPTSKGVGGIRVIGPPSRAPILGNATIPLGSRLVSQRVPFKTD
jgi:hypothetical protein